MWTPKPREKIEVLNWEYNSEDIVQLKERTFKMPAIVLEAFKNRNKSSDRRFHAYLLEELNKINVITPMPYIALYDSLTRMTEHLDLRETACIVTPNEDDYIPIPDEFSKALKLREEVSVVGNGDVIEIWNPRAYTRFNSSGVRGIDQLIFENEVDALKASYSVLSRSRRL